MNRSILIVFCAAAVTSWGGCNRSIPTLTVDELLANPQSHSHKMVKVRGCFVSGFEKSVLRSCKSQNQGESIWVEEALVVKQLGEISHNHPEFKGPAPIKLLFEYDERREKRVWKELNALLDQEQTTSEVVLLGQFETIAPRIPETMELGFGHLNAYANELILVDVPGFKQDSKR